MFCHPLPRNRACRESRGAAGFVVIIRRVLCRYGIPSRWHATLVIFLDNDRDVAVLLLPIRPSTDVEPTASVLSESSADTEPTVSVIRSVCRRWTDCQCRWRRLPMLGRLSVSVEAGEAGIRAVVCG